MKLIFDILKKLKNHEIRHIRNQLNASPFEYEKVGALFDLVTRYKDKEEEFYAQKIYGTPPGNTFRVTKSRLKKLLEDVVLSDKSLNEYSADYINSYLQARKRLLQGEILLGRGAHAGSKNLLLQVVSASRRFSLHNEHFQSELLLHRSQAVNMSAREFQKRSKALLQLNQTNYLVNEAAILHYSVSNMLSHKTSLDKASMKGLQKDLDRIKEVFELTQSPLAHYYYLLSHILFYQHQLDFNHAFEYCKNYLALLQKEPSVRSKQRLGSAYFQLTEVTLLKGDLKEAKKYATETLNFFSPEETNYLIVLNSAFRIAFYRNDYTQANRILDEALRHPRLGASKMREAIWHYFKASLLLMTGEHKSALTELNEATSLLSDKMGWNLAFRVLEIMILFEGGHQDLLESKILNMRQFVKRTQKNSEFFRPMQLIGILMELHKHNLDLRKAYPSILKKMRKLEDWHEENPFNPTSTELIRLENWIESKAKAGGFG